MDGSGDNTTAVGDVLVGRVHHARLQTQIVRTDGLIAEIEVGTFASFVNTECTGRIRDVEKGEIIANPRFSLPATSDEVHGVRSSEGKGLILGQKEGHALPHSNILVRSGDTTAHHRFFTCGFARHKIVISVVSDVIGATGGVNLKQVYAAAISGHPDTNLVAVYSARPVSDAISVDLATKHPNRRRIDVVGSNRNGSTLRRNTKGVNAGRKSRNNANAREHVAGRQFLVGSVILERVCASR